MFTAKMSWISWKKKIEPCSSPRAMDPPTVATSATYVKPPAAPSKPHHRRQRHLPEHGDGGIGGAAGLQLQRGGGGYPGHLRQSTDQLRGHVHQTAAVGHLSRETRKPRTYMRVLHSGDNRNSQLTTSSQGPKVNSSELVTQGLSRDVT